MEVNRPARWALGENSSLGVGNSHVPRPLDSQAESSERVRFPSWRFSGWQYTPQKRIKTLAELIWMEVVSLTVHTSLYQLMS